MKEACWLRIERSEIERLRIETAREPVRATSATNVAGGNDRRPAGLGYRGRWAAA